MQTPIWHSNPIALGSDVVIDVTATAEGVTLGEFAGKILATDVHLNPVAAKNLACALHEAVYQCLMARSELGA